MFTRAWDRKTSPDDQHVPCDHARPRRFRAGQVAEIWRRRTTRIVCSSAASSHLLQPLHLRHQSRHVLEARLAELVGAPPALVDRRGFARARDPNTELSAALMRLLRQAARTLVTGALLAGSPERYHAAPGSPVWLIDDDHNLQRFAACVGPCCAPLAKLAGAVAPGLPNVIRTPHPWRGRIPQQRVVVAPAVCHSRGAPARSATGAAAITYGSWSGRGDGPRRSRGPQHHRFVLSCGPLLVAPSSTKIGALLLVPAWILLSAASWLRWSKVVRWAGWLPGLPKIEMGSLSAYDH